MSRGSSLNFVRDRDKLERADERNGPYYSRKEAAVCAAMRYIPHGGTRSCDKISMSVDFDMQSVYAHA